VEANVRLDDWQKSVEMVDEIMISQYHKQRRRANTSSVLVKDQGLAFVYSHLVMAPNFL
jgi:hypothetical protein